MANTLTIKNMVCDRCKTTVLNIMNAQNLVVEYIELGHVVLKNNQNIDYLNLEKALDDNGFKLIKDAADALIEKIKIRMIQRVTRNDMDNTLPEIATELGKTYAMISKAFSKSEGITLEKYFINLKIENVKEQIQLDQLNFSEIAYKFNYKNSSHLAKQFKSITSMSMTEYKKLQNWDRKGLDEIV
jgi:AraC-like DNA-binding protein